MRRLVPLLLLALVLAACSTAGGDTTTTPPLGEPSTTSTTAPTTTTIEPTTTTTEEQCVDRDGDGVLRNRRGFVCPPYLPFASEGIFLPGRYETRIVTPSFAFTRDVTFESTGEDVPILLDETCGPCPLTVVFTGNGARDLTEFPISDQTWIRDVEQRDVTIGGYPATQIEFGVDEGQCESGCATDPIEGFQGSGWGFFPGHRASLTFVDTPNGPIVFNVEAWSDEFDTYWTEVAQPILDSIEFLER